MPFIKYVLVIILFGSTTVIAAPQDKYSLEYGIELWGGLKTGMTRDEVTKLNLDEKFELVEDCRVKFRPIFRDDRLFSVIISSRWTLAYNRCAELVHRSLSAKYNTSVNISEIAGSEFNSSHLEEQWMSDKIIVTLGYRKDRLLYINYEPRLIRKEADLIDNL